MKLTGEQIRELAEFADGADCRISKPQFGINKATYERHYWVVVTRIEDKEKVVIYDTGQIERVTI